MNIRWSPFVFVILLIYVYNGEAKQAVECGPNEMPKENPHDCVPDCCPIGENAPCPNPCQAGPCRCSLMSSRARNGTCIDTRHCPPFKCGRNEVYDSCPVCSELCSNSYPGTKRCRSRFHVGYTVICKPKCRCIDYYWRNNRNKCVPYFQCPQFLDGYQEE
ncbi:unnamed protein product [Leptosia nina]|uniref:TIL domain-containing protein n=1 Tax=Leptosia nina TaxID=320188 RepID=A0AAV1JV39_9NEOP